ncbi:MAG TPA: ATP-binding protein, partial [Stenomitos sp.]
DVLGDIIQNLAATFVFLDTNWIYRMVTHQTATMLGQTVDQMLGRHFLDVFPGGQAEMDRMHQAVCVEGRTLTSLSSHVPIRLADGTVRDTYWDYTVRPVHDRDGVLLGFTSIGFEVTERVALERAIATRTEDLERANRELKASDRYKDEFLSVISHELKTPLNFIMGFASILGDEVNGPLNEQQRLEVQRIQEGSVRLLELINDLLDMGQMAADKFQLTLTEEPFGDLVHEALLQLRPLAEHRRQQLDADIRIARPLMVDHRRIRQVFSNLVGNAIRFTPEGGRILVRATQQPRGIRVEVFDTGPGIAPEDVGKVFTLFKQLDMSPTRPVGGTGLGLCISKALVEAHGGRIGVDSKPGEGSCFWFELPDAGS